VERFPAIMYIGAAVLAWTAVKMMLGEPLVKPYVEQFKDYAWLAQVLVVAGVVGIGYFLNRNSKRSNDMVTLAINEPAAADLATTGHAERAPVRTGGILLPINAQPESRVAAEHLARTLSGVPGAHVHLLHVSPALHRHISRFLPAHARRRFVDERVAASLQPVSRLLELAGVKTTVHVESAVDVASAVLALAEREKCSRIVMGATRKSTMVRSLTNSVTGRVLAGASVPVEVVSGREASMWQRIGVPASVGLALAALLIELD
jgi:nucleotide-binding universal stress UspA family protein